MSIETAKYEVEILLRKLKEQRQKDGEEEPEFDYTGECYKSALRAYEKAYESLEKDGHSGFSWGCTIGILMKLLKEQPLSPITDDDEWIKEDYLSLDHSEVYHCPRYRSLAKYIKPDGKIEYIDFDRIIRNDGSRTSWCSDIVNELFPIKLPYTPPTKPYVVYCEDFDSVTAKPGYFDTYATFYIIKPDGERVDVNRYEKETSDGWVKITEEEYNKRKEKYQQILKRNSNAESKD